MRLLRGPRQIRTCLFARSISFYVAQQHLNLAKQLPEGIYDIRDLEIARGNLVKHRREQEKIIATNEGNLDRTLARQQFLPRCMAA